MNSRIDNHMNNLIKEIVGFYFEYKMYDMGINLYQIETNQFIKGIKNVIDEVKRVTNIVIDDILEQRELELIQVKNFYDKIDND